MSCVSHLFPSPWEGLGEGLRAVLYLSLVPLPLGGVRGGSGRRHT